MDREQEQFTRNFGVRQISRSYPRARYDSFNDATYSTISYDYNRYEEELLDVEMTMRGWDELMRYYRMNEKCVARDTYEHIMRQKHPAIKDAYEKYQMLMELYR
tara:strand:- start:213 stop:524 length:312 start_codon:yes stop_codon:yes gene_type:complete